MLFAMIARDVPGGLQKRLDNRPAHLDHLKALGARVIYAGALLDDADQPEGSLVILEADTIEEARTMAEADPFIAAGVFASYELKPWRVAINNTGMEL